MLSGIRLTKDTTIEKEDNERGGWMFMTGKRDDRYKRDVESDLRLAFDFFIEFKKKLEVLHPQAVIVIEKLLQDN